MITRGMICKIYNFYPADHVDVSSIIDILSSSMNTACQEILHAISLNKTPFRAPVIKDLFNKPPKNTPFIKDLFNKPPKNTPLIKEPLNKPPFSATLIKEDFNNGDPYP